MPFRNYPQPNVHHWKPGDHFDQEADRLLVKTSWDDSIVLAWSSGDMSDGSLIVAPEVVPENVADHFGDVLDPFEYASGRTMTPYLYVTQLDDNRLSLVLAHPRYEGSFDTSGSVESIRPVKRSLKRYPDQIAGYTRRITERKRAS